MTRNITKRRMTTDSEHEVVKTLVGGAELHRFYNAGGAPTSAVYYNGIELGWSYTEDEKGLLKYWKDNWRELVEYADRTVVAE